MKWELAMKGFHPHFILTTHRLTGMGASIHKEQKNIMSWLKTHQVIMISRDAEKILTHPVKGDRKK